MYISFDVYLLTDYHQQKNRSAAPIPYYDSTYKILVNTLWKVGKWLCKATESPYYFLAIKLLFKKSNYI